MTPPLDDLEPLALGLRAEQAAPPIDLAAQRRRLQRDPKARLRSGGFKLPAAAWLLASAALVCALVVWHGPTRVVAHVAPIELTAAGHRAADGSFVELAPGGLGRVLSSSATDLSYELVRGSAHVSVVPQVGHHWSIAAGPYTVSVIGTAFQVDFEAPNLQVRVDHGIVSVSGGRLTAPVRLEQGARLRVGSDSVTVDRPTTAAPAPQSEPARAPVVAAPVTALPGSADKKPSEDWESLYGTGDYRKAVALAHGAGFERLVSTLPEAKLAKLADASRLGGDDNGARLALNALQSRFSGTAPAERAVFLLGTLDARSGSAGAAIASFERYLGLAPRGPFASEATGRLMQLYSGRGQSEKASQMAASYLKREPNGPYVRLARSLSLAKAP